MLSSFINKIKNFFTNEDTLIEKNIARYSSILDSFYTISMYSSFMRPSYESDLKCYIANHEDTNFSNSICINKIYINQMMVLDVFAKYPKLVIYVTLPLNIRKGIYMNAYLYNLSICISSSSVYIPTVENLLNTRDIFFDNFHINKSNYINNYLSPIMCNIQHKFCEDIRLYLPELKELIKDDNVKYISWRG